MTHIEKLIKLQEDQKQLQLKIQRQQKIVELEAFKTHMLQQFDKAFDGNENDDTLQDFFNMDFTISFGGRCINLSNSAETFETVENLIDAEIENLDY